MVSHLTYNEDQVYIPTPWILLACVATLCAKANPTRSLLHIWMLLFEVLLPEGFFSFSSQLKYYLLRGHP